MRSSSLRGGWPARTRALEEAAVSIWDFDPVGDGEANDSVSLQNALDSGFRCVDLGSSGTFRVGYVAVPAGVTLRSTGAALVPLPGSSSYPNIVHTGGAGARLLGVRFDATADAELLGGESCVTVGHSGAEVQGCSFVGNGFRYGVLIQSPTGGACDDTTVSGNRFDTMSFGIYKDGNNGTTAARLMVQGNRLVNTRRGDAIEINVGPDVGVSITDNVVDGAYNDGGTGMGFGIGVAGNGAGTGYTTTEGLLTGGVVIANNVVRNVDGDAIHLEAAARFSVTGNVVAQGGAQSGTGQGVVTYGCIAGVVTGNDITGFDIGIVDDLGVNAGSFVTSSGEMVIRGNLVRGCSLGIHEGIAGTNRDATVSANNVSNCTTGIRYQGNGIALLIGNVVKGSSVPFNLDANASGKSGITSTTKVLRLLQNQAYTAAGADQVGSNVYASVTGVTVTSTGNNFTGP